MNPSNPWPPQGPGVVSVNPLSLSSPRGFVSLQRPGPHLYVPTTYPQSLGGSFHPIDNNPQPITTTQFIERPRFNPLKTTPECGVSPNGEKFLLCLGSHMQRGIPVKMSKEHLDGNSRVFASKLPHGFDFSDLTPPLFIERDRSRLEGVIFLSH